MSRRLLIVLALAAALFAWRLDRPGYSDTEGMFAEPAREMVVSGDWVTPRMNGEPFLTKPPLAYWLAATVMAVAGPTEWARVWPALAALGTIAATAALGAELLDAEAGLLAAVVLATMAGMFVEARFLRADMLLVLAVTVSLLCYARFRRRGDRSLVAFWATIGLGLLDKGFLAVILPGGAIALTEIGRGELRLRTLEARLRALALPLGAAIVFAIALPWHLWAGTRNPGFLWDYVVNQHLLFFFDEKLPRDSIPDSLGFFLTMFLVRGLPWTLLLPAAALHAWRRRSELAGLSLVASWIVVVLALFSLALGRLEHYSMPAVPAAALLVGLLLRDAAAGRLRVAPAWVIVPPVLAGLAALGAVAREPGVFLRAMDPALLGWGLESLVRPALLALAAGPLAAGGLVAAGRPRLGVAAASAAAVAFLVCVQLARERVEPLFSWRPFAETIRALEPAPRVFFRAEDEYQLCGGLDYYLGRNVALLAPPGWVPPTFLAGRTGALFAARADLVSGWRRGEAVLVADAVAGEEEARLAPGPYTTLLRAGDRVLLRSGDRLAGAVRP